MCLSPVRDKTTVIGSNKGSNDIKINDAKNISKNRTIITSDHLNTCQYLYDSIQAKAL